jgi:DNA-directed RNA polymerase omega subunit
MIVPENIGSKYRMIVLAGKRVAQLQQGASPKVEGTDGLKATQIAMKEILEGKLEFKEISPGTIQPEEKQGN